MTDQEFERVCSYLARTYGLNMSTKRVLLECRLSRERERLGCASFSAYFDLIESNNNSEACALFVDLVTTHYTYFMRENKQLAFIEKTALAELSHERPTHTWRILCAGCATGEECYTVSMIVEDYYRLHSNPVPRVRITGIDVSEVALTEARKAVYSAAHIEKVPLRWRTAYFKQTGDRYTVANRIRNRVSFQCANLHTLETLATTFDLIMCRNVIIYFENEAKQKVLNSLYQHLAVSGYLILGHAEAVRDNDLFTYCGNSIYQKRAEGLLS